MNDRKLNSRQENFYVEKDNILVSLASLVLAWFNTSLDPIDEFDQTKHSFWGRVHELYEKNKKSNYFKHSVSSLTNTWSTSNMLQISFVIS